MDYEKIENKDYNFFHRLLEDCYREGENADTPQSEIDDFTMLFKMVQERKIEGRFAQKDGLTFRLSGLDTQLALYAEKQMFSGGIDQCCVSAYGPAQRFWEKCGYSLIGLKAGNGLPVMLKNAAENNR